MGWWGWVGTLTGALSATARRYAIALWCQARGVDEGDGAIAQPAALLENIRSITAMSARDGRRNVEAAIDRLARNHLIASS